MFIPPTGSSKAVCLYVSMGDLRGHAIPVFDKLSKMHALTSHVSTPYRSKKSGVAKKLVVWLIDPLSDWGLCKIESMASIMALKYPLPSYVLGPWWQLLIYCQWPLSLSDCAPWPPFPHLPSATCFFHRPPWTAPWIYRNLKKLLRIFSGTCICDM